jgi:hypothetical protein
MAQEAMYDTWHIDPTLDVVASNMRKSKGSDFVDTWNRYRCAVINAFMPLSSARVCGPHSYMRT